MNRSIKVTKYMLKDTARAVVIFYIVIVAVVAFGLLMHHLYPNSRVELSGMKFATTIFLFVAGLNMFKSNYLFMQANGVTRRQFYLGGVLALAAVAVAMTVVDTALYAVLGAFTTINQTLSPEIYPGSGLAAGLVWTLAINLLAIAIGWFLTMLFYRANKPLKWIIAFSPTWLSALLQVIDLIAGGKLEAALYAAFKQAMGLVGTPNAYIGAFSMLAAAVCFAGFCFLLVRRAPVKEQDR